MPEIDTTLPAATFSAANYVGIRRAANGFIISAEDAFGGTVDRCTVHHTAEGAVTQAMKLLVPNPKPKRIRKS